MTSRAQLVCCILLCLGLEPSLAAQVSANYALTSEQLWDFGVWAAEAVGKTASEGFGQTQISMAGVHVGYVFHRTSPETGLRRSWEYTLELQPLFFQTREVRAYGGGFAPIGVKWNFAPRRHYRPYLEFNGGAMFTDKNVPAGPTSSFNFTAAFGPGATIALSRTQALTVALRFWHLSNAYIGATNPSFNTVQFQVGYHWLTRRHEAQQQTSGASAGSGATD